MDVAREVQVRDPWQKMIRDGRLIERLEKQFHATPVTTPFVGPDPTSHVSMSGYQDNAVGDARYMETDYRLNPISLPRSYGVPDECTVNQFANSRDKYERAMSGIASNRTPMGPEFRRQDGHAFQAWKPPTTTDDGDPQLARECVITPTLRTEGGSALERQGTVEWSGKKLPTPSLAVPGSTAIRASRQPLQTGTGRHGPSSFTELRESEYRVKPLLPPKSPASIGDLTRNQYAGRRALQEEPTAQNRVSWRADSGIPMDYTSQSRVEVAVEMEQQAIAALQLVDTTRRDLVRSQEKNHRMELEQQELIRQLEIERKRREEAERARDRTVTGSSSSKQTAVKKVQDSDRSKRDPAEGKSNQEKNRNEDIEKQGDAISLFIRRLLEADPSAGRGVVNAAGVNAAAGGDDGDGDPDPPKPDKRKGDKDETNKTSGATGSSVSGKKTKLKVGTYDGNSCLETFLLKFDGCATYNGWSDEDKLAHLMHALEGNAAQLLHSCRGQLTYIHLREKLRQRYGAEEIRDRYIHELRTRRQKPDETLAALANEIERLSSLGFPDTSPEDRDRFFNLTAFLDAIADVNLSYEVRKQKPRSLKEALNEAVKIEMWSKTKSERESSRPRGVRAVKDETEDKQWSDRGGSTPKSGHDRKPAPKKNSYDRAASMEPAPTQPTVAAEVSKHLQDWMAYAASLEACLAQKEQQKYEHPDNRQLVWTQQQSPAPQPARQLDYERTACPRPPAAATDENAESRPARPPQRKPFYCFNCNEPGHYKSHCPLLRQEWQNKKDNRPPEKKDDAGRINAVHTPSSSGRRASLRLKLNGFWTECLLDTGCELTVLPARLVDSKKIKPTTQRIVAANGSEIPVLGTVKVFATIGRTRLPVEGLVSAHVFEPMLGITWMENNHAVWAFHEGVIRIRGKTFELFSRKQGDAWVRRVLALDDTEVPPRSEFDIPASVVYKDPSAFWPPVESQWATRRREIRSGLYVAGTVVPDDSATTYVRVANVCEEPVQLPKGTVLSDLEQVDVLEKRETTEEATPTHIRDMLSRVDESVPQSSRNELEALLNKYAKAFSVNEYDLGWTDKIRHKIDTGNNPPARQALRKVPIAQRSVIDKHVDEQLKQGIIQPTQSAFAANLVIVKKHDGTTRCCCDYRGLNLITKRDAYPLPRMDQCLDALGGDNHWFSCFDLRSSYHQVAMDPEDAEKTAFICHRGLFRYATMPMGLMNSGATFHRLMDLVMAGLIFEKCLVYLDDIIVFSRTLGEHLVRMEEVLKRLIDTGLKLKPSKCRLLQKQVGFLGHIVSSEGIATDPSKTEQIALWPRPTDTRQVRGFLGLCSYYRRFIDRYAEVASPLTALLRKGLKFQWSDECEKAFVELKTALTSPPLLAMPRDDDQFILDTDASDRSIGAVLSQMQDGKERVIAYASRVLQPAQKRYCVTRRELLAIVEFTRHFRQYLLGRRWLLRTDHSALTWLRRTKEPIGQNARWLEQLEEYDFEIVHRPGVRHGNADALSRHPCPVRTPCTACKPEPEETDFGRCDAVQQAEGLHPSEVKGELWTRETLVEAQKRDREIGPVYAALKASSEQPSGRAVGLWSRGSKILWHQWPRLSLRDGVMYRRWEDPEGVRTSWQVVVPEEFRKPLFDRAHSGMSGGHLGLRKTEDQLNRRMYWPTWRTDAKLWVTWCGPCAQYHRGVPPRQAELNPFPAAEPFEVVSIDITGPHPRSRDGNEFILTVVDSFTKFAEAFPIRNHTATTVARKLVDGVFARYGVPLRLLSDQGPEFESSLIAELCRVYGIEKMRTSSYKPSTNGACERFHRTLNSMLGKVVSETQRDWDRHVGPVMAAYRSTVHESTGYSPNFLMFGRENRAPVDLVVAVADEPTDIGTSTDSFVQELIDRQRKAHDIARQSLGRAAERRKREYDFRVKNREFGVNEWVWYHYPRRYKGRSPKWSRTYTGPFLVIRTIPPCNYVLQKTARSKPFITHADKLKKCFSEVPKSWLTDCPAPPVAEEGVESDAAPDPSEGEAVSECELVEPVVEEMLGTPVAQQQRFPSAEVDKDVDRPTVNDSSPDQSRNLRKRECLRRPARYVD